MRVLLANSTCKIGGVSTFLLSLRTALTDLGHQPEMFFFEHGPMEAHLPPDARVHFGSLADLLRLVARERIDVVHANNVDWATGISAVRHVGPRLVLTAHKVRETAWTYGWTASNCDALVAVSRWIRDGLQPFTDAPIHVVHNGIDTRRFHPGHAPGTSPPIVAWVGRGAAPRKRLEAFAAIAPLLRRAGLRIWVIDQQAAEFAARSPDDAAALRGAAERWEGMSFAEMPGIYRDIAASGGCVVSTASMEGLPLTLLEAQACGCIVVGANVQGVDECVSEQHGSVLYPLDMPADDLAALIRSTLSDRDVVRRRQAAVASYVEDSFSLRRMAARYVEVYQGAHSAAAASLRARGASWRLSPIHWAEYTHQRVGVAYGQLAASTALAATGDWRLAAGAARASFVTAPTIYTRPSRLRQLLSTHRRAALGGGIPEPIIPRAPHRAEVERR